MIIYISNTNITKSDELYIENRIPLKFFERSEKI